MPLVTRRTTLTSAAAGLFLAACGANRQGATELGAVLDTIAMDMLRESPELATSLGLSEEQAGGAHIGRLSDSSREGLVRGRALLESGLQALRALDREQLSQPERISYDVVTTALEDQLASQQFDYGGGASQPYVVTQLNGAYTGLPDFLDSRHPLTSQTELDGYLSRLTAYARMLNQESERIAEDARLGVVPPDFAIDGAIRQLGQFAALPPTETVLLQSLRRRIGDVADLDAAAHDSVIDRALRIVSDEVLPAYRQQIAALTAVRPQATHDAGIWRLPQGDEAYAAALRLQTTTSLSPDEIHQMGVELVAELGAEMDALLRQQGLTRGAIAERIGELARRPDQLYPNNDDGRAQLLADLNDMVRDITARMPEFFGVQARSALEIRRIPPYTESGAAGGYYWNGTLDGSRPGAYYINLRDLRELPKFGLPTLTYHEGVPGHHWQVSIAQEASELPLIRSALLFFNSYVEGWALYAEHLADEIGVYENNPLGRLGFLQAAAFRAARLVVDTGIHQKRWSREQAIETMVAATGDDRSSVSTEVERYAVSPGQACGYMVGRQAILRMREEARRRTGGDFDLRAFHDLVLSNGSTPLSVLERLVSEWRPR